MADMTAEGKLMQARIKLRNEAAYIGDLLIYLQPEFKDGIETMGVDRTGKLYVSRPWVDKLTPANVTAVIVHEVLHVALMHPFREPPEVLQAQRSGRLTAEAMRKHHLFNVAIDLKVNYMMHEIGKVGDLPETELIPSRWGSWCSRHPNASGGRLTIDGIDTKSAEQIYKELLEWDEENGDGGGGGGCQIQQLDDHSYWAMGGEGEGDGDGEGDGEGDGDSNQQNGMDAREAAGDWMVRVAGALNAHKGTMPGSLRRELEEMLTPKIDWRDRLQRFVQPIVATDTSYRRPRRTSWVTGIILPGPERGGVKLIAHVDTSGSMGDHELQQIAGELYGMLDSHPHVDILLLHSDAGTPEVIELRETDKGMLSEKINFEGGCGTSHRPVVQWMQDNNEDCVEALICFTDGDSDIQHCFDDIAGVVTRMLMITRDYNMDRLAPYCEDICYLPC